ncbi:MAG: capsule biosynthesis protein [Rikenellaceae bacterium]|nr:capsule biosynthesis protein [Rikenellaceae bacterium]
MKRIIVLLLFTACLTDVKSQSREGFIEAYRNGTLSDVEIAELKRQYGQHEADVNMSRSRGVSSDEKISSARSDAAVTTDEKVFGQSLFRNKDLTFEPEMNIATPEDYLLGTGDEVIIDLWGDTQLTLRAELSPEGSIVLKDVGPVTLAGLTIKQAKQRLRRALMSIYEGLADGSVKMMLSLGNIRSIKVDVVGEVAMPGSYTLPSLATLFHALYLAGGVNDIGSLRTIALYRGGKQVAEVDMYDYIISGRNDQDVALRGGDLIVVPTYNRLVNVVGAVKRPMHYEMRRGETLADAIAFAGDFLGKANRSQISVVRRQGGKRQSFTVSGDRLAEFEVEDGDEITIDGDINRHANRVEVRGAVYRDGFYAIDDKMQTLTQLLQRAEGLREDAFTQRALLYREGDDLTTEVVPVDLQALLSGECEDVALQPNDILVVSTVDDMQERYTVGIYGAVNRSGDYPYATNMSVKDLLVEAGGLQEAASTANITITRRIKSPDSRNAREQLFEIFTIDLDDGVSVGGSEFSLEPFDQVFVRRSPVYITQSSVTIDGEVAFEGQYPLSHRNMRLSEVVEAAGGLTSGAFAEGAYLLRRMTPEERIQNDALHKLIDMQRGVGGRDSLKIVSVAMSESFPVGINLAEAMAHPGSDADIVLRDGDVISIPKYNGSVRVMGTVLYPNSVTYKEGKRLRYYIDAAGGFGNRARRKRTFVIYMNGMVKSGLSARVRPGCVVIVPAKSPAQPLRWAEIAGLISTSATTAAVVLSAISIAK